MDPLSRRGWGFFNSVTGNARAGNLGLALSKILERYLWAHKDKVYSFVKFGLCCCGGSVMTRNSHRTVASRCEARCCQSFDIPT